VDPALTIPSKKKQAANKKSKAPQNTAITMKPAPCIPSKGNKVYNVKKVVQLDPFSSKVVKVHASLTAANAVKGIKILANESIGKCCKGLDDGLAGGFKWRYEEAANEEAAKAIQIQKAPSQQKGATKSPKNVPKGTAHKMSDLQSSRNTGATTAAASSANKSATTYLMEHIVKGPRKQDGKFWVKWQGWESKDNTWEPPAHLDKLEIQAFLGRINDKVEQRVKPPSRPEKPVKQQKQQCTTGSDKVWSNSRSRKGPNRGEILAWSTNWGEALSTPATKCVKRGGNVAGHKGRQKEAPSAPATNARTPVLATKQDGEQQKQWCTQCGGERSGNLAGHRGRHKTNSVPATHVLGRTRAKNTNPITTSPTCTPALESRKAKIPAKRKSDTGSGKSPKAKRGTGSNTARMDALQPQTTSSNQPTASSPAMTSNNGSPSARDWTKEEDRIIIDGYAKSLAPSAISKLLTNRTYQAVQARWKTLPQSDMTPKPSLKRARGEEQSAEPSPSCVFPRQSLDLAHATPTPHVQQPVATPSPQLLQQKKSKGDPATSSHMPMPAVPKYCLGFKTVHTKTVCLCKCIREGILNAQNPISYTETHCEVGF
jgi:hypothetical protein